MRKGMGHTAVSAIIRKKEIIICTMDDVRGDFLGPPHGTTPGTLLYTKLPCISKQMVEASTYI